MGLKDSARLRKAFVAAGFLGLVIATTRARQSVARAARGFDLTVAFEHSIAPILQHSILFLLHVEPKLHDVPVLNYVLFSFDSEFTCFSCFCE